VSIVGKVERLGEVVKMQHWEVCAVEPMKVLKAGSMVQMWTWKVHLEGIDGERESQQWIQGCCILFRLLQFGRPLDATPGGRFEEPER